MKNKKGFLAMNIGLIYILPWLVGSFCREHVPNWL